MPSFLRNILLLSAFSPLAARADTISVFAVTGNHVFPGSSGGTSGPAVSGTISIDVTSGQVISMNLTPPPDSVAVGTLVDSGSDYTELNESFNFIDQNGGFNTTINLALPTASLIGYTGGFICSTAHSCLDTASTYVNYLDTHHVQVFTDGGLSPLSPAPEPNSLILLGTGVVSLLGVVRAKRHKPSLTEAVRL